MAACLTAIGMLISPPLPVALDISVAHQSLHQMVHMEIGPLVSCESNINRWILRICDIKLVCIFHVADFLDLATKKVCLIAFPCRLFLLAPLYEYAN